MARTLLRHGDRKNRIDDTVMVGNLYQKRRRALIADDARATRWLLRGQVERLGFICHVADNGWNAFQQALSQPADLVITDIEMPYWDGIHLMRAIRNSPVGQLASVPIVICSSLRDRGTVVEAIDAGASAFVTKPLAFNELRIAINIALQDSRSA